MPKIRIKFDQSTGLTVTETAPGEYTVSAALVAVGPGTVNASAVVNTPAGGIAASDVQGALNELDTEKVGVDDFRLARRPHTHLVSDVIGAGTGSSSLVFSKGIEASKPALAEGEMYWATDTDTLFIGT